MNTMPTLPLRGLHPGARLLLFVLRDLADESGAVCETSGVLLEATGWANRASLRKRMHDLEDNGFVDLEPTYRENGGRGPNIVRLTGKG
ncbi:hypothetical protein I8D64_13995 [Brachybacterium sp. MASK1Z-5]|uniref:MarR family transcriptional regulator n=1 Tax=Brachybacterium halotolerans TaxID=2795215 RepID=A0ABS1BD10_9MICO|nr:hypothetical protein [Brachybacterium halotolerans]MBK0332508.1 hypothetical protein [Brachybacterium halotolerans]